MEKTLIGKNNYLFLKNDACQELEVHCNNLNLVQDPNLTRYNFKNFLMIVFPNKSLIYKEHLPDEYCLKYRPALDIYNKVLNNKIIDTYTVLKDYSDVYYKTDTHINVKGSVIVYNKFIQELNKLYNLNIKPKEISMLSKTGHIFELTCGVGDLLMKNNLGEQIVEDYTDTFYYSNDIEPVFCGRLVQIDDKIRILNKELIDQNEILRHKLIDWSIISENILYQKNNCDNNLKVVIFYDSYLCSVLSLYLELFAEVYMIKDIYNNDFINTINPDYVFEFRVERFLF